jgi:hypothetical protein
MRRMSLLIKYPQWTVLGLTEIALFVGIGLPFLGHNTLLRHDLIGHLASAAFTETYLFPSVSGYNPFYYCGAPQNLLYPPLLAYASAALGRWVGVALAMKLIMLASVLATPVAVHWCARAHGFSRGTAALSTLVATAGLALWPQELGGNFMATFEVGNAANAVGLPLFLAYAAALASWRERPKQLALATLLLGLNLVTHLVGGMVAIMLLGAHACVQGVTGGPQRFHRIGGAVVHSAWGLALAAFFVVPMLAFRRYGAQGNISYNQYPDSLLELCVGVGILVAWYASSRPGKNALAPIALLSGLLLFSRNFVFNDFFPQGTGLHIHRFKLYDGLLLCLLAVWLVDGWLRPVALLRRVRVATWSGGFGAVALLVGLLNIDAKGPSRQAVPKLPRLPARVLVLSAPQHQVSDHTVQHLIPMRTGNAVAKGLFIESAANARYLLDLERLVAADPNQVRTWGVALDSMQRLEPLRPEIRRLLALFGFGFVLANEPLHPEAGLLPIDRFENDFVLYRANYAELAEIWTGTLHGVSTRDFGADADRWFFVNRQDLGVDLSSSERLSMPELSAALASRDTGSHAAKLTSVQLSARRPQVILDVDAETAVPVFVKMTYAPQFEARDELGRQLPILRVTPNFMLVVGRGRISMEYVATRLERTCATVSWVAAGALAVSFLLGAASRLRRPLRQTC